MLAWQHPDAARETMQVWAPSIAWAGAGLAEAEMGGMVADIGANWAGNWRRIADHPAHLAANAPWLITAFGLFVFATALPLARPMTLQTAPASS